MGCSAFWGRMFAGGMQLHDTRIGVQPAFVAPPLECRRIAQWKTEISSAMSGRSKRRFSAL